MANKVCPQCGSERFIAYAYRIEKSIAEILPDPNMTPPEGEPIGTEADVNWQIVSENTPDNHEHTMSFEVKKCANKECNAKLTYADLVVPAKCSICGKDMTTAEAVNDTCLNCALESRPDIKVMSHEELLRMILSGELVPADAVQPEVKDAKKRTRRTKTEVDAEKAAKNAAEAETAAPPDDKNASETEPSDPVAEPQTSVDMATPTPPINQNVVSDVSHISKPYDPSANEVAF